MLRRRAMAQDDGEDDGDQEQRSAGYEQHTWLHVRTTMPLTPSGDAA